MCIIISKKKKSKTDALSCQKFTVSAGVVVQTETGAAVCQTALVISCTGVAYIIQASKCLEDTQTKTQWHQ